MWRFLHPGCAAPGDEQLTVWASPGQEHYRGNHLDGCSWERQGHSLTTLAGREPESPEPKLAQEVNLEPLKANFVPRDKSQDRQKEEGVLSAGTCWT